MSVIEFPASAARQTHQDDNLAATLIRAGIKPKMARAISQSVLARLTAHQGPDIEIKYSIGMAPAELKKQVDVFACILTAPLLLEIVKMEVQLHQASEALAAATTRAHAR